MRLKVDKVNDALYFRLDETVIVDSEEVKPGVILDFDENGQKGYPRMTRILCWSEAV